MHLFLKNLLIIFLSKYPASSLPKTQVILHFQISSIEIPDFLLHGECYVYSFLSVVRAYHCSAYFTIKATNTPTPTTVKYHNLQPFPLCNLLIFARPSSDPTRLTISNMRLGIMTKTVPLVSSLLLFHVLIYQTLPKSSIPYCPRSSRRNVYRFYYYHCDNGGRQLKVVYFDHYSSPFLSTPTLRLIVAVTIA